MRVIHVLEGAGGGTSRHLRDLVRFASGVEHHIVVRADQSGKLESGAHYDVGALEVMERAGGTIHPVEMRRTPVRSANVGAMWRTRELIRVLRPDVVHGHSSVGGAIARLAAGATGTPVVYTPHALATGRIAVMTEKALAPLTTRFVAVSKSEAEALAQLRLAPAERIAIIRNGIDLDEADGASLDLRAHLGVHPATPLIGTTLRLVPQKAPEQFVAACAAVARLRPDAHFLLIGMGPLQPRVDEAVRAAGLRDHWHQITHLEQAAGAIGQLDVFVLTSRFEGAPYTPLEAMRAGVPVVLSDVVGNRDVVEDRVSGTLVPFGAADAAGQGIVALLEDRVHRKAISKAASQRLAELFDVRQMAAQTAQLYGVVAATRRRTRKLPQPSSGISCHRPEASASQ